MCTSHHLKTQSGRNATSYLDVFLAFIYSDSLVLPLFCRNILFALKLCIQPKTKHSYAAFLHCTRFTTNYLNIPLENGALNQLSSLLHHDSSNQADCPRKFCFKRYYVFAFKCRYLLPSLLSRVCLFHDLSLQSDSTYKIVLYCLPDFDALVSKSCLTQKSKAHFALAVLSTTEQISASCLLTSSFRPTARPRAQNP